VTVKTVSQSQTLDILMNCQSSVHDLKVEVSRQTLIPVQEQVLTLAGKSLESETSIASLRLANRAIRLTQVVKVLTQDNRQVGIEVDPMRVCSPSDGGPANAQSLNSPSNGGPANVQSLNSPSDGGPAIAQSVGSQSDGGHGVVNTKTASSQCDPQEMDSDESEDMEWTESTINSTNYYRTINNYGSDGFDKKMLRKYEKDARMVRKRFGAAIARGRHSEGLPWRP
jgi:hypothetical protein